METKFNKYLLSPEIIEEFCRFSQEIKRELRDYYIDFLGDRSHEKMVTRIKAFDIETERMFKKEIEDAS